MADVALSRSHSMTKDDARTAVERVAEDLKAEYGVLYEWAGDTLRFEGRGAEGTIDVHDDAVDVAIDLGFMLRTTMKGTIQRRAEALLDEHLS